MIINKSNTLQTSQILLWLLIDKPVKCRVNVLEARLVLLSYLHRDAAYVEPLKMLSYDFAWPLRRLCRLFYSEVYSYF